MKAQWGPFGRLSLVALAPAARAAKTDPARVLREE